MWFSLIHFKGILLYSLYPRFFLSLSPPLSFSSLSSSFSSLSLLSPPLPVCLLPLLSLPLSSPSPLMSPFSLFSPFLFSLPPCLSFPSSLSSSLLSHSLSLYLPLFSLSLSPFLFSLSFSLCVFSLSLSVSLLSSPPPLFSLSTECGSDQEHEI